MGEQEKARCGEAGNTARKKICFSASRRTDIPTYYSEWLCNRLEAGNVCVRHDARRVTRYVFSREAVDCLVLMDEEPAAFAGLVGVAAWLALCVPIYADGVWAGCGAGASGQAGIGRSYEAVVGSFWERTGDLAV